MIRNFADRTAQDVYDGIKSTYARRLPIELHKKARRLLDQINTAATLETLCRPPGNRLEKLTGDYEDFWSIRINNRFRIVFRWEGKDALDMKIVDYH